MIEVLRIRASHSEYRDLQLIRTRIPIHSVALSNHLYSNNADKFLLK